MKLVMSGWSYDVALFWHSCTDAYRALWGVSTDHWEHGRDTADDHWWLL